MGRPHSARKDHLSGKQKSAPATASLRQRLSNGLAVLIEGVVLLLVVLTPWAFGAVEGIFELLAFTGVGLLLLLWAVRTLVEGGLRWRPCPLAICLALLFVQACLQLLPLPAGALRILSPETSRLYAELLPASPEVLPEGQELPLQIPSPGSTLSLYPTQTRRLLIEILAVLSLYLVVRNNIDPKRGLKRLAITATVNAILLAMLAQAQLYTSSGQLIYWKFIAPTIPFGPFICRNHFPFYVNICFGLGLGLLLSGSGQAPLRKRGTVTRTWDTIRERMADVLNKPGMLWLGVGLALILSSSLLSLSRGGLFALVGTSLIFIVGHIVRTGRAGGMLPAAGILVLLSIAIIGFFGMDKIEQRYSNLWKDVSQESRIPFWRNAASLVPDFWLTGTGFGTFRDVEPLHRSSSHELGMDFEHAHNEYLEALVEGGIPRLLLMLGAIAASVYFGLRASSSHHSSALKGLIWGAMFGLSTAFLHSGGEFGIHVPAIMILLTVLAAYVCSLGDGIADPQKSLGNGKARPPYLKASIPLQLSSATAAVAAAFVIFGAASRELYEWAYFRSALKERFSKTRDFEHEAEYLESALAFAPANAQITLDLGQALEEDYQRNERTLESIDSLYGPLNLLAMAPQLTPGCGALPMVVGPALCETGWLPSRGAYEQKLIAKYLYPAVKWFIRARNLCPMRPQPHIRLAIWAQLLSEGDSQRVYLARAKALAPYDPDVWYRAGILELIRGEPALAWESWRRSINISDQYMGEIVSRASLDLAPDELIERILEDDPHRILVSSSVYSTKEIPEKLSQFLRSGVRRVQPREPDLDTDARHSFALLLWAAGEKADALKQMQRVIAERPEELRWRLELAGFMVGLGDFIRARHELTTLLALDPNNKLALELLGNLPK